MEAGCGTRARGGEWLAGPRAYTESTICGQPWTHVERKVMSIGKFHTASGPFSDATPDDVDICVIPSSTPFITPQSVPCAKPYRQ